MSGTTDQPVKLVDRIRNNLGDEPELMAYGALLSGAALGGATQKLITSIQDSKDPKIKSAREEFDRLNPNLSENIAKAEQAGTEKAIEVARERGVTLDADTLKAIIAAQQQGTLDAASQQMTARENAREELRDPNLAPAVGVGTGVGALLLLAALVSKPKRNASAAR